MEEARQVLEKGLALGRSAGFALNEEWMYADDLAVVYDLAVQSLITSGKLDQAKTLLAQVEDYVAHYKTLEKFEHVRHAGYILLARGMLAANERQGEQSIHYLKQLLASPFKEYFASDETQRFVLALACENIGRTYFLKAYRVKEAIPYFEEALRYYDQDDSQLRSVQELLAEAKSQAASPSELPALPAELREKLDSLRSGDDATRLDILEQIPTELPPEYFRTVKGAIMQAMGAGDSRVRLRGATVLARMGDESYSTVNVLLGNLTPPPSPSESKVKRFALYGLSYVKGREDVVKRLIDVAQHDNNPMVRERAVFALAATGNPAARQFVTGLASAGDDAAAFALEEADEDVESLRDAIFNGREILPSAAMKLLHECVERFEKGFQESEAVIRQVKGAMQTRSPAASNEVAVRLAFSLACGRRFGEVKGDEAKRLISESVTQLERAATLDSRGGYGVLAQHLEALPGYDVHCSFEADSIAEKDGPDAAITFLEQKLGLFEHVPGDPLTHILENLGERYYNRHEDRRLWRQAKQYLQRVMQSQPIPGRESDHEEMKVFAAKNLAVIEQFVGDQGDLERDHADQFARPMPSGGDGRSTPPPSTTGDSVQTVKLRLFVSTVKRGLLQLYCPLRSRRESIAPKTWHLMGTVPPTVVALPGVVLLLLARGPGGVLLFAGLAYLMSYLYISFLGPSAHAAKQALDALPAQREALLVELAAAEEREAELYVLKLEQEANSVRENSRVLTGGFRFMCGAVLSLKDGERSSAECLRYCTIAFKLGWIAITAIKNIKNQEQYDQEIGGFGGNYTEEQITYCWKMLSVFDEIMVKGADSAFLSNNPAARNTVGHVSETFLQYGTFSRETIESTLGMVFTLGYIAAKSPDKLQRYVTILTSRQGGMEEKAK